MKATKTYFLMAAALVLLMLSAPLYAAASDASIEEAANNSYTYKTYLKDDDVKVQVKDGVLTLTGTVAEESRKKLAEETVKNLPGVTRVDNQLEVKQESTPDIWLLTKVKTTLLIHGEVNLKTNVDVKDGVVTLTGEADNQAQKELTGEYAMDIEGVKSVNNEMTVSNKPQDLSDRSMGEKIDDASITAMVKTTLLIHRSTSGLDTKVETRDGVVSLSGKAANEAEKELAAKLAGDIKGVRSVDNNMTVSNTVTVK